jgi:hypothetical protein
MDAVQPRSPEAILKEWRDRERQLDEDPGGGDVETLQGRIADLRDEHHRAIDARKGEADELRRIKP